MACLAAVAFRYGADTADIVVWCISLAAFASGLRNGYRERKQEDLTGVIFPDGQE